MKIAKIVSGGQTGVDRAALDAALGIGLLCGGWCPKGRKAEDGPLPARYSLKETPDENYEQRTEWNVRDSDSTLILTRGKPTSGTALTIELAAKLGKPCFIVDFANQPRLEVIREWIEQNKISVLNVAGPRESLCPGIYKQAFSFLSNMLL